MFVYAQIMCLLLQYERTESSFVIITLNGVKTIAADEVWCVCVCALMTGESDGEKGGERGGRCKEQWWTDFMASPAAKM